MEALVKVVVIMTQRYGKVLKRGKTDRNMLLFRSLAVFDRSLSVPNTPARVAFKQEGAGPGQETRSQPVGFAIDEPGKDDDDVDDDELALAALESLDVLDSFKSDDRDGSKIRHAQIPVDNFRKLVMLLLLVAPLGAQENLAKYAEQLTETGLQNLRRAADSIIWAFTPEEHAGISYHAFNTIIPTSLPYLFDGLNPLFERFLFSKNVDLSRRRRSSSMPTTPLTPLTPLTPAPPAPDPLEPLLAHEGDILTLAALSQLSFFLKSTSLFRRLRLLYAGSVAGFSINALTAKLLNWRAPTILLVAGTRLPSHPSTPSERTFADKLPPKKFSDSSAGNSATGRVVFGGYLSSPWKMTHKDPIGEPDTLLFQLEPIHEVFPASSLNRDYVTFTKDGLSFGNPLPRARRPSGPAPRTLFGPVSLTLDSSLEFGVFTHDSTGGGAFHTSRFRVGDWQDRFEIEELEVWGCGGDDVAEGQRAAWAFEEREAAARRGIRRSRDVEADKALLEMAGIIGQGNSGGSV
jgi:hypothetical protein